MGRREKGEKKEKSEKTEKKEKSRDERRKTAKCHLCGEIGHVKFDCPKKSIAKSVQISTPPQIKTIQNPPEIKNINTILRYCREFRYVTITFDNGKKSQICCSYDEKGKGDGKVRYLPYESDQLYDIQYKTVKYFWDNITKYRIPISLDFTLYYNVMIQMLGEKKLVKYTYAAEDKRSGCNLLKLLEIDGVPVNHDALLDCAGNRHSFSAEITALFQKNVIAPRNCRKQMIFICWINKNRYWHFIPKDILRLILKRVWHTRRHRCWRKEKFDIDKVTNLKVLY